MPTIINFTAVTPAQVGDTLVAFNAHTHYDLFPVPVIPETRLVFEGDLPRMDQIRGAIIEWGDPQIDIVISIMNLRARQSLADFTLFAMTGEVVHTFEPTPRYTMFSQAEEEEGRQKLRYLVGEWDPGARATLDQPQQVIIVPWENRVSPDWPALEGRHSMKTAKIVGELPGGWWATLKSYEKLTSVTRPPST